MFRRFFRMPEPYGKPDPIVRATALVFLIALFVFVASTNRPKPTRASMGPTGGITGSESLVPETRVPGGPSLGTLQGQKYQVVVHAGSNGDAPRYTVYSSEGTELLRNATREEISSRFPELDLDTLLSQHVGEADDDAGHDFP